MALKSNHGGNDQQMLLDGINKKIQQQIVVYSKPPNNWSDSKISEWLMSAHSVKCSHVSVNKWLSRRSVIIARSIYGDKNFMKAAQREYGIVIGRWNEAVGWMLEQLREVCKSNEDKMTKAQISTMLTKELREMMLVSKQIVVGEATVDEMVTDIEREIENATKDLEGLSVVPPELQESLK